MLLQLKEGDEEEDFSAKKCLDALEVNPPYIESDSAKDRKASAAVTSKETLAPKETCEATPASSDAVPAAPAASESAPAAPEVAAAPSAAPAAAA